MALKEKQFDQDKSKVLLFSQSFLNLHFFYRVIVLHSRSGRYKRLQNPRIRLFYIDKEEKKPQSEFCKWVCHSFLGGQGCYRIFRRMGTNFKNIPEDSSKRNL